MDNDMSMDHHVSLIRFKYFGYKGAEVQKDINVLARTSLLRRLSQDVLARTLCPDSDVLARTLCLSWDIMSWPGHLNQDMMS